MYKFIYMNMILIYIFKYINMDSKNKISITTYCKEKI